MNTSTTEQPYIFSRRIFILDPALRSLARIISSIALVVFVGFTVTCLISDVPRLFWVGVFCFLMLIDYIIHFSSPHYTVRDLFAGRVPKNNIALCLNHSSLSLIIRVLEKVHIEGGDFVATLLYVLSEKHEATSALERLDIDMKQFHSALEQEITKSKNGKSFSFDEIMDVLRSIVLYAVNFSYTHSRDAVDTGSLIAGVCSQATPGVAKVLDLFSITAQDVEQVLVFSYAISSSHKLPSVLGGFAKQGLSVKRYRVNRTLTSRPTPTLDMFSRDLTDYARLGQGGFLIGHTDEYKQFLSLLSSGGTGRNVMLVGEPGVGKEALTMHLAFQIISDDVPVSLFDRRLVELSISNLTSGATQDVLSARINTVSNEIIHAGNIILFIPDAHLLAKTDGGGMGLSDMLMPIIRSDAFPVIASTYPREYKEYVETNSLFKGMFQTIRINEISLDDARTLLTYDALLLEGKYHVTIYFSAIKQAVTLASKYIRTTPLPSSAQDLLRESLADATQRGATVLKGDDVVAIVERKVKVPIHITSRDEAQTLLHLEDTIHTQFIDQDYAVTAVAQALRAYRSGLARRGGPIASFLFVGPTGVGKTELSKILAKLQFGSENCMVRFDMSEYQGKDTIVRFIGSPDGRIAGALTESIILQPYSLILLDEFEKAHPDLLNLFLQVFDEGRLTDSLGRVVDFQNTIIIATSNAHSVFIQEHIAAGVTPETFGDELKKKLTEVFRPELLNRFSDIIVFRPLAQEYIAQIAKLQLKKFQETLRTSQGISIDFSDEVIADIAKKGYDPMFGARPLRKVIDQSVTAVLSQKILSGDVVRGEEYILSCAPDGSYALTHPTHS